MSTYKVEVNGVTYSVALREKRGTSLLFAVDGVEYSVSVNLAVQPALLGTSSSIVAAPTASTAVPKMSASANAPELCAPIPGIVSDLKVTEGQTIQAGEVALVLEAMKMENPIKAHRSGTVSKIHVGRGQEVAHGTPLITISES
jgi:biotin carboxyl carrier protein